MATAELQLDGMHCSARATRTQRALGRLPAVASASVSLATARAHVAYDPARLDPEALCHAVSDTGYTATFVVHGHSVESSRDPVSFDFTRVRSAHPDRVDRLPWLSRRSNNRE